MERMAVGLWAHAHFIKRAGVSLVLFVLSAATAFAGVNIFPRTFSWSLQKTVPITKPMHEAGIYSMYFNDVFFRQVFCLFLAPTAFWNKAKKNPYKRVRLIFS